MAFLLHAVALAALLWMARELHEAEPPPIAVELLVEPQPGPQTASPPAPSPPPLQPLPQRIAPARPPSARAPRARAEARPAPVPSLPATSKPSAAAGTASPAPPSAPDRDRVYGEGEVDAVAAPSSEIVPRYPPREQMLGREGTVVLAVTVEADGRVRAAHVVQSGGGGFDAAAREAVTQAPFRAARRAGHAVASLVNVRVRFRLD